MRTIETETGTYKIADSRDLDAFIKHVKKPKIAAKRYKGDVRSYPRFEAGKTSTRDYVRQYYHLNHQASPQYVEAFFGVLPTTPAPDHPIEDDVIEVSLCS